MPTVRPEHQHLVDFGLLPSLNTAPGTDRAAFMPEVLTPGGHLGKWPVAPGNPPPAHLAGVVESGGSWVGYAITEPMSGATEWTSPAGVTYQVDPATGRIIGRKGN